MGQWQSAGLKALAWGAAGTAARVVLQLAAQVMLARLLGPSQYGLFALGAIVVGISSFVADVGLAYGLIQRSEVTRADVQFVWTWQVLLGVAVTAALVLGSGALAAFFRQPEAASVVAWLAPICLFNALSAPSLNLLKRQLDFRRIQLVQLQSYLLGFYAVGLPMAWWGGQVWALVVAWLVQAALSAVLLYRAARHPLGWLCWYPQATEQMRYAGTVLATNLMNWVIANLDRVVVGRSFSPAATGAYTQSLNLLMAPVGMLTGVLQPVFFSTASRISGDRPALAQAYLAGWSAVAVYVLPAFAVVAVLAQPIVLLLLGPAWQEAVPVLAPLAIAMPALVLMAIATPVLWVGGRVWREFLLQIPMLLVWLAACHAAAAHGLVAVAWTVAAMQWLRALVLGVASLRALGLPLRALGLASWGGLGFTLVSAVAATTATHVGSELSGGVQLAFGALLAGAAWLAIARLWPQALGPELRTVNDRWLARLPAPLWGLLNMLGSDAGRAAR